MTCYCANYYGSVKCQYFVSKFGDRCALCLSTQTGASASRAMLNGIPQASEQWVENAKREQLRRQESEQRRQRVHRAVSS